MAFDANLKYLPNKIEFFAEAYRITKKSALYTHGIRKGQMLSCEKTGGGDVFVNIPTLSGLNERVMVRNKTPVVCEWLVFDRLTKDSIPVYEKYMQEKSLVTTYSQ